PPCDSRLHTLLARAARRVAVERYAESAARSHRESPLVLQHLQLRELGAGHVVAGRGVVGATRRAAVAARPPARRALSGRPRQDGLSAAAARLVAVVAPAVPRLRPLAPSVSTTRLYARPRNGDQRVLGL